MQGSSWRVQRTHKHTFNLLASLTLTLLCRESVASWLGVLLQRTGLDGVTPPQQQQQPRLLSEQQQQPAAGSGPHSYPLPDAAITGSSSSSYRSSTWLLKRVKQLLHGCQRAVLNGVAAVADRLNWW
jgi:hypothetical protein